MNIFFVFLITFNILGLIFTCFGQNEKVFITLHNFKELDNHQALHGCASYLG